MRIKGRKRDASPADALSAPIRYAVPVGESGSGRPLAARSTDSIVRVYAFEKQHAANQRIAARRHGKDFSVSGQNVRIRTAIGPDNRVVAAQGQTTTVLRDEAGRTTLLRELAYTSDVRRAFLSNVSRFFGEGRRIIPQFALLDAFGSRLRIEGDRREILEATGEGVLERLRETHGRKAVQAKRISLPLLEEGLRALESRGNALLVPGLFDGLRVVVSDTGVARASVSEGAVERSAALSILRLATGPSVASSAVADPSSSLNLKGDIFVNDVRIQVQKTDGLGAIARRINAGEDINENGILDNAEDRNHNRILDNFEDANGNGVLDTGEDDDGDGELDAGEDLNYNGRLDVSEDRNFDFKLDGGVSPLWIQARIDDKNRLAISSPSADLPLRFRDPDGILQSIGLLAYDVNRELVPAKILSEAQKSDLAVDGKPMTTSANRVTEAIPRVELELLNEGETTVTVDRPFPGLSGQVEKFIRAYNDALALLNGFLSPGGLFDGEPAVGRIRLEFAGEFEDRPDLAGAGLEAQAGPGRLRVHELPLAGALSRIRQGLEGVFDRTRGPRTAANSLESLGITRVEDGQIRFDATRFARALSEDRKQVREALAGPEGAITKAVETVRQSVDPDNGRLGFLSERLKKDPESGQEVEEALERVVGNRLRTAALNVIV